MCATSLRWRHLVNAYGVKSLVRLIAATQSNMWQLLAYAKPYCYTWPACRYLGPVLRGSLLYVC